MVHLLSEKLIYLYTIYNIYIYVMASSTDTCMRSEHFQSPAKDQCHPLDAPALQGVRWAFSILFPFWLGFLPASGPAYDPLGVS